MAFIRCRRGSGQEISKETVFTPVDELTYLFFKLHWGDLIISVSEGYSADTAEKHNICISTREGGNL
jgi:hypothetical protein